MTYLPRGPAGLIVSSLALALFVIPMNSTCAQLAVIPNDNKLILVNGVQTVVKNGAPDTLAIIDLSVTPVRMIAEIENVPCSVIGPPLSAAITPDESLALVTASMKVDPADPTKQTEDNRMSVIDLQAKPPKVIAMLECGKGPAGVSINRQGTLALVANRGEGSISAFSINGKTVTNVGKLAIADAAATMAGIAFTPDGKQAWISRDGDNTITLVSIDGIKVTLAGRDLRTGLKPYPVEVSRDGSVAICADVGMGTGDVDPISVIDMKATPPRVVDLIPVGQTPEGLKLSPDGKWCAIVIQNGTNKAKESPFYAEHGKLILFRIDGTKLTRVADAPVGHWPQGVAFSADGRTIVVTNMVEKNLQVFQWDGSALRDTGQVIQVKGGPVAIRTADK